jgi:hypothetical protein
MNSPLETGLFLPIRFYESLAEQDRYKHQSVGVSYIDENFVYVDCKTLAPFQLLFSQMAVNRTISWKVICEGTLEETTMPYNAEHWQEYVDIDLQLIWTSYLGNDDFTGMLSNGRHWIEITIEDADAYTRVYYSDKFVIMNCITSPYDIAEYRKTTPSDSDLRLIDATNLRIVNT